MKLGTSRFVFSSFGIMAASFALVAHASDHTTDTSMNDYLTLGNIEVSASEEMDASALQGQSEGTLPMMTILSSSPITGAGGMVNPPAGGGTVKPPIVVGPSKPATGTGIGPNGTISTGNVELDQLINLGVAAWKVIDSNRPVVTTAGATANALPAGTKSWDELTGWKSPKTRVYRLLWKNLLGMTVVDYSYRVNYTYGGSVDGRGQFLSNVSVTPAYLSVLWGFNFNATAVLGSIVNEGRTGHPVAGMEITSRWKVDTVLRHLEGSADYFVNGYGQFSDMSATND